MSRFVSRRSFLKYTAAAALTAALSGCIPISIPESSTYNTEAGGLAVTDAAGSGTTYTLTIKNKSGQTENINKKDFRLNTDDGSYLSPSKWNMDGDSFAMPDDAQRVVEVSFSTKETPQKLYFMHGSAFVYYNIEDGALSVGGGSR